MHAGKRKVRNQAGRHSSAPWHPYEFNFTCSAFVSHLFSSEADTFTSLRVVPLKDPPSGDWNATDAHVSFDERSFSFSRRELMH